MRCMKGPAGWSLPVALPCLDSKDGQYSDSGHQCGRATFLDPTWGARVVLGEEAGSIRKSFLRCRSGGRVGRVIGGFRVVPGASNAKAMFGARVQLDQGGHIRLVVCNLQAPG